MSQFIKIYEDNPNEMAIKKVVDVLKNGGLIIYPTDTVYGLGCDITNLKAMEKIKQESKQTIDNLRAISKEQPEMLAPLMMGYEMTDGNIKTISALNEYVKQSTGVLSKAFIDLNPEIPSRVSSNSKGIINPYAGLFFCPTRYEI